MNIKLTSQILSSAVGNVLKELGPPEGFGIAELCVVKDEFFNCLEIWTKFKAIFRCKEWKTWLAEKWGFNFKNEKIP